MASAPTTTPTEWSVEDVQLWLASAAVNLDQATRDKWRAKGVNGAQLLALDRRALDGLGVPVMRARAVEFQIQKLKDDVTKAKLALEEEQRTRLINERIQQNAPRSPERPLPSSAPASPTPVVASSQEDIKQDSPQITTDSQKPAEESVKEAEVKALQSSSSPSALTGDVVLAEADSWTLSQVSDYFLAQGLAALAEYFTKNGVDGAKLVAIDLRAIIRSVNFQNLGDRRKAEHVIEKLKEAVKDRRVKEEEKLKRRDAASLTSVSAPSESQKHIGDDVFLIKKLYGYGVTFEIENGSAKPIRFSVTVSDTKNIKILDSDVAASSTVTRFVLPEKGKKVAVAEMVSLNPNEPWSFKFEAEQREATYDDFSDVKDEQTRRQLSALLLDLGEVATSKDVSALTAALKKANRKFIDPDFPPVKNSLYIDLEDLPKKMFPIQWKRPEEFSESSSFTLFANAVTPDQIEQGRLGDCWFMAALSIISVKPELVLNMFHTKEFNSQGIYKLRFYRGDEWVDVVVDDYLPSLPSTGYEPFDFDAFANAKTAKPGGLVYARARNNLLWVCLLEKAYAKLNQ